MNRYEIMSVLTRLEASKSDPYAVSRLFADTLADIADRITVDEMRRLLIVGAYIHHNLIEEASGGAESPSATSSDASMKLH